MDERYVLKVQLDNELLDAFDVLGQQVGPVRRRLALAEPHGAALQVGRLTYITEPNGGALPREQS